MAKSTGATPKRQQRDFPLGKHPRGYWIKRVKGKLHYFGKIADDPDGQAALNRWLDEKDDLLAGRVPRKKGDYVSVGDLCTHFLNFKRVLMEGGELAPRTHARYKVNCDLLVETFGTHRAADDLIPDDFLQLRAKMTQRWSSVAVANEIGMARSIFTYGYKAGLLTSPVRFGPGFDKPSAKTLRVAKAAGGERLFTPREIKSLLQHATPNIKAMVLLAINGGLGNTDLALLPLEAIDLKAGWLGYARAKTAIPRRIPLWPETVKAVKAAVKARHEPARPDDAKLLFIGRRGESYVGGHKGYRVHQEFTRVCEAAKVKGRTFYDFRRTFATIGEGSHDLVALQHIMGHAPATGDMQSIYRQRIDDERLRAVVDHVHRWLFGK